VSSIIQNIREQSVVYYHALDLSIKTVEDGYTFSSDSEYLCDFLVDPNNTTEDIQEFIDDMRQIARQAHEDAKVISEMFRGVRQNLNQVSLFTTLSPSMKTEMPNFEDNCGDTG